MNQPSPMNITPGTTPGATPSGSTQNGAPRTKIRKPQKPADPFMRRKPQQRRREPSPEERTRLAKPQHSNYDVFRARDGASRDSALVSVNAAIQIVDSSSGITTSGFTTAAPGNYKDYPVVMTKRQLSEGLRYHAARFYAKNTVNPANQSEWTRPVRLHRRDPKMPLPGQKPEEPDAKDVEMEEEKEKAQALREQRQAQREAEMSEIAPSLTGQQQKRFGKDQKKFVEVRRKDETEAKQARSQLSYEEALPWHFEDDENKQIWIGTYEKALSEAYAQFTFRGDKVLLTPVEKWYKFTQQRIFKSQEELEAHEAKRTTKDPKFLRDWAVKEEMIKAEILARDSNKPWQLGGKRTANFSTGVGGKADREDADELDFDEDIADDEEDPLYDADAEETKETQKRIKKDQLKANIFDMKAEESYDEEEAAEEMERQLRKQMGQATNKLMVKREKNRLYASDSDESESDSDNENDPDLKKDEATEAEKQKLASGATSKGTNTPSGRQEKHRRLNSQDQSEASGNESSRRKHKKGLPGSKLASGLSTPNGVRSLSPGAGNRPLVKKSNSLRPNDLKRPRAPGSGSDGEGQGSGAEMSDGSRKKMRFRNGGPGSNTATPGGSRATSPVRDGVAAKDLKPAPPLPSIEQIRSSIPAEGIILPRFLDKWKAQTTSSNKNAFMDIVRRAGKLEKRDGGKAYMVPLP